MGGPSSDLTNYSIFCSYAICATEFDERIKTNIQNLGKSLGIISQLRPVMFVVKNKTNVRYELIAQDVKKLPSIVNLSYGQVHDINIEFIKHDIQMDNDKVTLQ